MSRTLQRGITSVSLPMHETFTVLIGVTLCGKISHQCYHPDETDNLYSLNNFSETIEFGCRNTQKYHTIIIKNKGKLCLWILMKFDTYCRLYPGLTYIYPSANERGCRRKLVFK